MLKKKYHANNKNTYADMLEGKGASLDEMQAKYDQWQEESRRKSDSIAEVRARHWFIEHI